MGDAGNCKLDRRYFFNQFSHAPAQPDRAPCKSQTLLDEGGLAHSNKRYMSDKLPTSETLKRKFPEWVALNKMHPALENLGQIHHLGYSRSQDYEFPLLAYSFGSQDPQAPTFGLFGGVHGLERIGSQVCLSLMQSFIELAKWDEVLKFALTKVRLVFFPIINPIGILEVRRSNPQGVDLMRNAPVKNVENPTWLVGGQTISPKLPWFRGSEEKMEVESQAVFDLCQKYFFKSSTVITLDCHSGFGLNDRLWFPYAKTTEAL
jgi:hypothetical protein